jgi:hypothetical protein
MWRLILDSPCDLAGFNVNLKYVFNAGFSNDSGCRVFLEKADSLDAIRRRIQEKSSETLAAEIARQETTRLNELIKDLGFFNTVGNHRP